MRSARRWVTAVLALALLGGGSARGEGSAGPTTTASAVAVEEARHHFQRGVAFYLDADYRSALVEFNEAYRVSPNYRLLFNVGQTSDELQDFAGAVKAFREYLAKGGAEIAPARRAEVEAALRRLEKRVATVEIHASEDGAEITAGGERQIALGTSPLAAPVLLNGGQWTITAQKPGFERSDASLTVAGGDTRTLTLTLPKIAEAPIAPAPALVTPPRVIPPRDPPRASRSLTPVWIGVAVSGALAVGAGVTGVLALGAKRDYNTQVDKFGATPDDIASARTRTRTFALTTDVLGGAAIAGAAATAIFYYFESAAPAKTGWLAPYIAPNGFGAHGTF